MGIEASSVLTNKLCRCGQPLTKVTEFVDGTQKESFLCGSCRTSYEEPPLITLCDRFRSFFNKRGACS